MWTEEFAVFQKFSWVNLCSFPDWETVKSSFKILDEKTSFDMTTHSLSVFEQFGYIKRYCNAEKIEHWKENKIATEDRWVEIFNNMEAHNVPFTAFSQIIEYILCFPGTSAAVERIFSKVNRIWDKDKSELSIDTLKSILMVKTNIDLDCTAFYKYLKSRPELLKKIASQDKYTFKQPNPVDTSPGAMSVTIDSDDE